MSASPRVCPVPLGVVTAMLIALLWGGAAANAQTAPRALSLAEAERLALGYSFLVAQAEAREKQALARMQQTTALNNPTLNVAGHVGQNTGGLDEDVILSETFALGGKRTQPILQARAELAAAHAQTMKVRADVVQSVDNAYFEAQRAEVETSLQLQSVSISQTFVDAAHTQYEAGDVARSNVVRSEIELSRSEQGLVSAQADRATRLATLRSLTGLSGDLALADALAYVELPFTLPALQAWAMAHAPDILAAQRLREAREAAWRGSRAQSTPDLVVEARSQYLNPFTGGTSVRVGVVFPVLDLGSLHAASRAAQGALEEQVAAVEEAGRVTRLDVETSFYTLQQTASNVRSFQDGRLERSRELLDMLRIGYKNGASSYLEMLDAQRTWLSDQTDYTRALAAYNNAVAALRHAVGGTLP